MTLQPISKRFRTDVTILTEEERARWLEALLCEQWDQLPPLPTRAPAADQRAYAHRLEAMPRGSRTICPPVRLRNAEVISALVQFAYALCEQPHVTEAWSSMEDGVTFVWVFIDEDTTEVRRQVFHSEQGVMDKFPALEFDFYVFSADCRDAFVDQQSEAQQLYVRT